MGNSGEAAQDLPQILRALNSVCSEMDLIPVQREMYVSESRKWIVRVREKRGAEFFTLELFRGLHRGLRFKFLDESHLMGFDFLHQFDDIHCFGYKSSRNISEWFDEKRAMSPVSDDQVGIIPIIKNLLEGMFMLTRQRLWHQKLTLDNVRMMDDDRARLGALELIMPEGEVRMYHIAPLAHWPPELLAPWTMRDRSLIKVQMWILGSQLLELLIGKHISGKAFHQHDPTVALTRWRALKNIRRNIRYLPYVLAASELSFQMQGFLTNVLAINPNHRVDVIQAMMHFGKKKVHFAEVAN